MSRTPTANVLLDIAENAHLFRTPDGAAYATLPNGITDQVDSQAVRCWLRLAYRKDKGGIPNKQAVEDTVAQLQAQALYESPIEPVYLRVGHLGDAVYLDLGCKVVEVTREGWSIREDSPVRFVRPNGFLSLPEPVHGGSLDALRPFVPVTTQRDWVMIVSWLLGALHPKGPYTMLAVHGEQGSGKTDLTERLRNLIDPQHAETLTKPKDAETLRLNAQNIWIVAIDNVSSLSQSMSDDFCRLCTGYGDTTRKYYTNKEQVLFKACRTVLFNGIPEFEKQGDFLERLIIIPLPVIDESRRRPKEEMSAEFEQARPSILGALLDGVVAALKNRDTVSREKLPRMADFTIWLRAAEERLGWTPGTFDKAYAENRATTTKLATEASPIVPTILKLPLPYNGDATDLYRTCNQLRGFEIVPGWPKDASAFSQRLKRDAPALRNEFGINVVHDHSGTRSISITRIADTAPEEPDTSSYDAFRKTCHRMDPEKLQEWRRARGLVVGDVYDNWLKVKVA